MRSILFLFTFLIFAFSVNSQKMPAYQIFDAKGKKVSYAKMVKSLDKSDVILFGELHNNPIAHWLQFELTTSMSKAHKLTLGAEMVEADNQKELNRYLKDEINQKGLDTLARLWPNHHTDYKPLVDFAKENGLPFVASNIPRRFANQVYRKGFAALDSLSAEEKSWIAPLPIEFDPEIPTYKKILKMMGSHGTPELVMAQATKDATMAHFILKNFKSGEMFIHYNGAFHSDEFEGILWYLKKQNANLNYSTISTVSQKGLSSLLKENKGKADFIIVVDENMCNTY